MLAIYFDVSKDGDKIEDTEGNKYIEPIQDKEKRYAV